MRLAPVVLAMMLACLPAPATATEADSAQAALVDLVILELFSEPARPLAGESYRLVATVQNVGSDALLRSASVAFSVEDVPLGEGKLVATRTVPLGPRGFVRVESPGTYVATGYGTAAAYAHVDARERIAEVDETNNGAWTKVSVNYEILSFTNPLPGQPYQEAQRVSLWATYDEPWARIDCAAATTLTLSALGRNGAHVEFCSPDADQPANSYTLISGEYVATFATLGSAGASLLGMPQGDPSPPEPHL